MSEPRAVVLRDGVLVCSECGELMRSEGGYFETLVGYMSPPGHNHDDNCRQACYQCPNGHVRRISKRKRCFVCDWVGKDRCFCRLDLKVDEWPKNPDGKPGVEERVV